MIRRLLFTLPAGFLLTACLGCTRRDETPVVHVYRLDGSYIDEEDAKATGQKLEPRAGMFREWPVLERQRIHDPALARKLAQAITTRANFGGPEAACFWPGMGIVVGEGGEQLDAVICLKCNWLYRYAPGKSEERLPLSVRGAKELTELYQQVFPQTAERSEAD